MYEKMMFLKERKKRMHKGYLRGRESLENCYNQTLDFKTVAFGQRALDLKSNSFGEEKSKVQTKRIAKL